MKIRNDLENLVQAQKRAIEFFQKIEHTDILTPGKTERQINSEIYNLSQSEFNVDKYWHKRIVRVGKNTLLPYGHNPPDLVLRKDDILFLDMGPVFDNWETDVGRTYVLGKNEKKQQLRKDIESAWTKGQKFYNENKNDLTGADFYKYTKILAAQFGWDYDTPHCGHLIGEFPHEKNLGDGTNNYIHPENNQLMCKKDINGNERFWIYEIHFIDKKNKIGGFFEQMLI